MSPSARRRRLVALGVITFLDYAAVSSLAAMYGPYLRVVLHVSLLGAVPYLAPAAVAAFASLGAVWRLSRPHRRFAELAVLGAFSCAGAVGLALAPDRVTASAFAALLGVGAGGTGAVVAAAMIDLGQEGSRGVTFGALMSVEGAGSVAGPSLVAALTDAVSPRAGLAATGALYGSLVVLATFVFLSGLAHGTDRETGSPAASPVDGGA